MNGGVDSYIEDASMGGYQGGCDSKTLPWIIAAVFVVALIIVMWYGCCAVKKANEGFNPDLTLSGQYDGVERFHLAPPGEFHADTAGSGRPEYLTGKPVGEVGSDQLQSMLY
jgi:hypothetical protein